METVKGFNDYTGEEARKRAEIKKILIQEFENFGFEPAETPVVEQREFVQGDNVQDEAVSDIFKLEDRGNRKLALRYEFTFQLKRIAKNKKLPYKRYSIGPVFRDEPVSGNRFRQFTQCDVDTIGSDIKDEAEVLALVSNVLRKLSISFTININNRKLMNEILDKENIKEKEKVIKEIDKLDKLSEEEIKENLSEYDAESVLEIFKKDENYFKQYDSYSEIEELKKYCKMYNTEVNFQPSLARGLSYYNGSVFEIKSDIKESICAGGSYLVNGMQSTGLSFGLERLSKLSNLKIKNKPILLISLGKEKEIINIAQQLRNNNISCRISFGKISKNLELANSMKLKYVLILGEEESKNKKIKLKNMETGEEELIDINKIIERLK